MLGKNEKDEETWMHYHLQPGKHQRKGVDVIAIAFQENVFGVNHGLHQSLKAIAFIQPLGSSSDDRVTGFVSQDEASVGG